MANNKLGALWQHKTKEGKTYLTGNIEVIAGFPTKIVIVKNDKKEKPTHPDWSILLSVPKSEGKKPFITAEKIQDL